MRNRRRYPPPAVGDRLPGRIPATCPSESDLDRTARHLMALASDEVRQLLDSLGPVPGASDEDNAVLAHAGACLRCGENLRVLVDTEAGFTGVVTQTSGLTDPEGALAIDDEPGLYALAAHEPGSDLTSTSPKDVIHLDGHGFMARVFELSPGGAAVAVLVHPNLASLEVSMFPGLEVGGLRHSFDSDGICYLPEFPNTELRLVPPPATD